MERTQAARGSRPAAGLVGLTAWALAVAATPAAAQDGRATALEVQGATVAIEAQRKDGSAGAGFGLIVHVAGNEAVIVTADHVVRGAGPDGAPERVTVRFHRDRTRPVAARVEGTRSRALDLAILRAPIPASAKPGLELLAPSADIATGTEVWFVGLDRDWFVPVRPGAINDVDRIEHRIRTENLAVRVGTSGAPLVAATGVVGLVVEDEPGYPRAVPIDSIRSFLERQGVPFTLVERRTARLPDQTYASQPPPLVHGGQPLVTSPPVPPPGVIDLSGEWTIQIPGSPEQRAVFLVIGPGQYEYQGYNLFGMMVERGTATVQNGVVTINGWNAVINAQFIAELRGSSQRLDGVAVVPGVATVPIALYRS